MVKQLTYILLVILLLGCAKRSYIDDKFFINKSSTTTNEKTEKYQIISAVLKDILIENYDNIIFNNLENKGKIYIAYSKYQKEEIIGKNKFYSLNLEKDYPQEIEGIQFSVKTIDELKKIAKKTNTFKAIEPRRLAIMDEKYAEIIILLYQFPNITEGDLKYMKLALKKVDTIWIVHKRKIQKSLY
ncbi:hypothetical protein [uncultured Dokdonia sp.]|uniref:hypothetical protein n=1 Tax=uncultured Dokdonia sp. TaxID=575653 RepID=UPI0026112103|nr:hypothetical protein [uncultured Dokdonia sp.]